MGKNFSSSENSSAENMHDQDIGDGYASVDETARYNDKPFAPPAMVNADGSPKKISTPVLVAMVVGFAVLAVAFNYTFLRASRQMQSLVPTSKPLVTRMSVDKLRSDHDKPKAKNTR